MEFLEFDKMDREIDEILEIYMDLGGEKFDTNFRNTRKDLRTLCSDFKATYKTVGLDQTERSTKLNFQKQTMEYKSLDFRIKSSIVRLGIDLIDIEREITRYCKQNNIHNERFYNKYEIEARKEARGGNVSDLTQSFGTNTDDDGFGDDDEYQDMYDNLNASSVDDESQASAFKKPKSDHVEMARPKVNKDMLNDEERLVQEMVDSVENFEKCLNILIKKEVYYQLEHDRTDNWFVKIPDRFKKKIKHFRDLLQNEVIMEVDEEFEESQILSDKQPEFELDGVDEIAETKEEKLAEKNEDLPNLDMVPSKKSIKVKKTLKLSPEEEMALDMFDELDAKMDDNLKLVSKELDLLGEKLDVAEEDLDKNAEMINEIDVGTQNLLTDIRDQNKQMKEAIAKFREPNKLICDIILIIVLCLFIGIFVFLLKRYFEIKDIIEKMKAGKYEEGHGTSRRLLII
jgi:hypothetical protein